MPAHLERKLTASWRAQALLWRAARCPAPRALEAWNALPSSNEHLIQYQAHLACVWQNLQALGVRGDLMELLSEQFWAHNQVLGEGGQRAQACLARAGIPSLVLKGAAMIRRYYPDSGLRSMGDYDVLVPSSAGGAALELLQDQGWRDADGKSPDRVQGQHGRPLLHPDHLGWSLDLHWYALSECRWPGADDGFWQRSHEGLLDPADELIVLCCQACRLKARSAWMLDATYLLEHGLNWTVLRDECRARRVEIPVAIALGYLRRELGLSVPDLGLASSCWTDRLYFHSKQSGPAALLLVTDFLRTRRPLSSFLAYLVERWGLAGPEQLPREAWRRVVDRSGRL